VRSVLTRAGGTLGESGSVGWMFDHVGSIVVQPGDADPEELALVAIDAGAQDVQIEEDAVEVYTEVTDLHVVQEALVSAGYEVEAAEPSMRPKTLIETDEQTAIKIIRMVEKLEELDDVQQVYSNLDVTDELLAAVS
jgi:transcriptional/translational regulatory protein YebC/TACO1